MKTWLKYKCRAKIPCFFQSSLLLWSGQLYNTVLYKHSLPLLLWPKKPSQCYLKHTSPGRLPSRVLGINLSILEIHFLTLLSGCPQLTSLALAPFSRINSKFLFELSQSRSPPALQPRHTFYPLLFQEWAARRAALLPSRSASTLWHHFALCLLPHDPGTLLFLRPCIPNLKMCFLRA